MTVHRLMHEMPSDEYTDWIAMNKLEPIGGHIADIRANFALLMLTNNVRRLFDGEAPLLELHDLIPWAPRPKPVVLHDPESPDYDAEKHAEALRALFNMSSDATKH